VRVGFVGLSHLGLNYSLATAAKGFEVIAYDPDQALSARCKKGDFPIEEPGFVELFAEHRGRLQFTSDRALLSECELVFYALDVRTDSENHSDLRTLDLLIQDTAAHLSASATMVLLSQVSPGYTRRLATNLARMPEVKVKSVFYQVETLIFGSAVQRAMEPERYIVGAGESQQPLPQSFSDWHATFGCPVLVMRYESAELAKIAINFFLVSSVTTTNVLAEVCEAIGADWSEIVPALRLDRRIGQYAYLSSGLGIAGGNLERDLVTVIDLSDQHRIDQSVVRSWQANSAHRRLWTLGWLERELFAEMADPVVAVWGLTYKPDTHSTKNSPALALLRRIQRRRVQAHDPVAVLDSEFDWVNRCASPLEAADGADALVVPSPWKLYGGVAIADLRRRMRGRLILDPYGALDSAECGAAGFQYHRLGC
jgi:UDPglucose 6-dehydrogenase